MREYITDGTDGKAKTVVLIPEPGEAVYHERRPRTKKGRRKQAAAMNAFIDERTNNDPYPSDGRVRNRSSHGR